MFLFPRELFLGAEAYRTYRSCSVCAGMCRTVPGFRPCLFAGPRIRWWPPPSRAKAPSIKSWCPPVAPDASQDCRR